MRFVNHLMRQMRYVISGYGNNPQHSPLVKLPDSESYAPRLFPFYIDKDSIMVYGWTIKRSGVGQDKEL